MDTIEDYVKGTNEYIFLPGIQREFVWRAKQIEELFDSLIRGFPIGSAVEWNVKQENYSYTTYSFIRFLINEDGFIPTDIEETYEAELSENSEEQLYTRSNKYNESPKNCELLIIDGQQRLTALKIGLTGSILTYTAGRGGSKTEPEDWEEKVLCVNLLGIPEYNEADFIFNDYEFKFKSLTDLTEYESEENNIRINEEEDDGKYRLWISLPSLSQPEDSSLIATKETIGVLRSYLNSESKIPSSNRNKAEQIILDMMHNLDEITTQEFHTVTFRKDKEHIPDIFQRLNTKGQNPKPYQLLLSLLMSDWPHNEDSFNPRKKIEAYICSLQSDYRGEFDELITPKFILRCICYISGFQLRRSEIDDLTDEDIDKLAENWYRTEGAERKFKDSIREALDVVSSLNFDQHSLDKEPFIALLVRYYYHTPKDKRNKRQNKTEIKKFLAMCLLLNEPYNIARRSKAYEMSQVIPEGNTGIFPRKDIFNHMKFNPSKEDIIDVIENTYYDKAKAEKKGSYYTNGNVAAILSLLEEVDSKKNFNNRPDIDHIFPVNKKDKLDGEEIHNIANLQLLGPKYNREDKNKSLPLKWIDENIDDFPTLASSKYYPSERVEYDKDSEKTESQKRLLKAENFSEFIEKRQEELIKVLSEEYLDN